MNKTTLATALYTALLVGCATTQPTPDPAAQAVEGYIEDTNKLSVVDCLLPGQLRKLGAQATYLSGRRPIRTTEADCEVRGGEYIAYDRANYASALHVWLPKAQEGDPAAQLYVGQIYEKGLGQPVDYPAAAQWYRKAAEQGNAQAQVNLGALYEKGLGVTKNPGAAADWYAKATGLESAGLAFAAAVTAPEIPPATATALAERERELDGLRQSFERSRHEAEDLRLKLAAAEQRDAERIVIKSLGRPRSPTPSPAAAQELERLRQAFAQSQREAEQLRAQLDAAQREGATTGQVQRENAELRAQLSATQDLRQTAERSQREAAALRAQLDASRRQFLDQQDELRASQEALETLRQQLAQHQAAAPGDDAKLRELEAALHHKETLLKAQQASVNKMAASFDRERRKLKKELASVKEQAKAPAAQSAVAPPNPAREQLAAADNALAAKMDAYRKNSAELTALLTGKAGGTARAEIDRRKAELQSQAREISGLKDSMERLAAQSQQASQPTLLAQAGPAIEILEPPVTLTRGVRTVQLGPDAKAIVGKIATPADLKSLVVNNQPVQPDAQGVFRFPALGGTAVKITATDKRDQTSRLDLNLVTAMAATEASTAPSTGNGKVEHRGAIQFGKFYALIIGNNSYAAYPALQTPANDAKSLDVVLRERYGFSTKLLLNASRHQIMTALNDIHKKLTADDNLLIYYAGHGEIDPRTQMAYWLPADAEVGNPANWISSQSITEFIGIMPARHVMVVADSCYSGALTGSAVAKLPDGMDDSKREKWLKVMASRKARTVLTSGGVQPVMDQGGGGGHSVFANAFLGVLRGNQRILEDYDVFRSVAGQVQTSAAKAGFQQVPQYAPLQHAGHEGSPFFFVPENV